MEGLLKLIEDNQYKYLFGFFDPEDKCWRVQPRKFILIEDKKLNQLSGQFLQSLWFNKLFRLEDKLHFIIMAVDNRQSSVDIEKDMNKLKNPFPTYHDIPYYLRNTGYYIMDQHIMMNCLHFLKKDNSFKFTLKSVTNPFQQLTLKLFENKMDCRSMYISTPSFKQILHTT